MSSDPVPVERYPQASTRSVRVPDDVWASGRERADKEEVTMSYVVAQLVEGYALGMFDLPVMLKEFKPVRR